MGLFIVIADGRQMQGESVPMALPKCNNLTKHCKYPFSHALHLFSIVVSSSLDSHTVFVHKAQSKLKNIKVKPPGHHLHWCINSLSYDHKNVKDAISAMI